MLEPRNAGGGRDRKASGSHRKSGLSVLPRRKQEWDAANREEPWHDRRIRKRTEYRVTNEVWPSAHRPFSEASPQRRRSRSARRTAVLVRRERFLKAHSQP